MGRETAPSVFTDQQYVSQWTSFTKNVTAAADILRKKVPYRKRPLCLRSLARLPPSCREERHLFVPCWFADQAMCSWPSLVQSCRRISQGHYNGSFCVGNHGVLQDFISESGIRGNLTGFTPDIAAV
ncbi:hypothetical protein EDB89DRAFT_1167558 [Lactarius sanguifluus]|nr:hypothetical protein EDB89DRAFT_1167558 [Lactarius sanguifluus]